MPEPIDLTQEFEGWSPNIYHDTEGIPTIGYGFNLLDAMVKSLIPEDVQSGKRKLTKEEADPIFRALYERAGQDAENIFGEQFSSYPPAAQTVFTDMSYNLGANRLDDFVKMIAAAQSQDWANVSKEMEDSKWYNQVGNRSKTLQEMINLLNKRGK